MDIEMVERHLAEAQERAALGEKHIASQHKVIAKLKGLGADLTEAERLLANFEDLQRAYVADRDRIERELAELMQSK